MDPTESMRGAYGGDRSQGMQNHEHHYNHPMISSDAYNFMTGGGVMEVPLEDQASQIQGAQMSEEGGGSQSPLIGTLYTNQLHTPSSGDHQLPKPNWDHSINGGGLFNDPSMQNMLMSGNGLLGAPSHAVTAQLLIGGLQGASFDDGGQSDHGSVYYASAPNNVQHPPMAPALYYVNAAMSAAGYNTNGGFHSDGHDQASATTIIYPTHDEGTSAPHSDQQFRVDPYLAAAAGGLPMSLNEQNYTWRNGGNEHSFLPMSNGAAQNHQSQFETHDPQYSLARHDLSHMQQTDLSHMQQTDLSHMQQTDLMSNGVGLHMDSLKGISVNGQGLSLSLSNSHQSQFHPVGGQLPENDQMAAMEQAAAIAKTKELASRYLSGAHADLSRFRTPSRDDVMETRFLQEHIDSAGRKHLASSSHVRGSSGAGPSNHITASRFCGSAQLILSEVCRVTVIKRLPKSARYAGNIQQLIWSQNMVGGSSASVDGNFNIFNGKEDSARSIVTDVDSGRDQASAFNIHAAPLLNVSHLPLETEQVLMQNLADAAKTRDELEGKKQRLVLMVDEVEGRYRRYCDQLQLVISSFNAQAGPNTATPYTVLALQAMSRHFRCLRDSVGSQSRVVRRALGEEIERNPGEPSRLRYVDNQIRQQRALQHLGMIQQHAWRPQRGLPERAVSVLRAWLFEHFLHPYPKDVDKLALAKQTGLTRSQVSNWFINARVRLWKPMVEEMYVEEQKENEERQAAERVARDQAGQENNAYDERANSGLLHEVSGNAPLPRPIPNGLKRNESDREVINNGPDTVTELGGPSAEVIHPHPVIPIVQRLGVVDVAEEHKDGREAKKARGNSVSDDFTPDAPLLHPEGGTPELVQFQTEDGQGKEGTQNMNQDAFTQQAAATILDHIQAPSIGGGAFGAFTGPRSAFGNLENELRNYATRAAAATTSTGTVSLTLGLRHCEANQAHISSMLSSPNGNPYINLDQMNQLNRIDQVYARRVNDEAQESSPPTIINDPHYLPPAEDNSINSNGQQLSPPHPEFNVAGN